MRSRWVAAALLAVTLAGCGETTSSGATGEQTQPTSGSTSSPTSHEASPNDELCPYLNAEQVSAALGAPVVETAGSTHACFFDPEGGDDAEGASVMLSRVDVQIEPADYAAQTRALCHGDVSDIEAGDEAFACVMGLGPQGQLYVGRVLVTVNVIGAADDAAGLAVAAALLSEVRVPSATG
jgi:hypothetical protein